MITRIAMMFTIMIIAAPIHAQATHFEKVTSKFEFNSLKFGQEPTADMLCINGPCLAQDQTSETRKSHLLFATYKKQKDITNYRGIEITSPKYQFYKNKLTRIIFEVDCENNEEQACLRKIKENLVNTYNAWLAKSVPQTDSPFNFFEAQIFTTETNEVLEFVRSQTELREKKPTVKIYNKYLLDNSRLAANPGYYAKEVSN